MTKHMLLAAVVGAGLALAGCNKAAEAPKAESDASATGDVATASGNPTVGGAEMLPTRNIVENASASPIHKQLVAAVKQAGLVETLSGPGPFTVFAPTDQAFAAVPQSMTAYLMDPGNKAALAQVLTYHVVPGAISSTDLYAKIKAGGGKATLTTVEGQPLTFTEVSGNIKVDGTQGSSGYVTQADVAQSNGMIHILNGVLIPEIKPAAAAEPAAVPADTAPAAEATPAS